MKSVNLKLPLLVDEFLHHFEALSTKELKRLSERLNQVINQRAKEPDLPENREEELLKIIKKQPTRAFLKRYNELSRKMENETIESKERLEMKAYIEYLEDFDTKKTIAIQEYVTLKNIPIQEFMKEFNPFNR